MKSEDEEDEYDFEEARSVMSDGTSVEAEEESAFSDVKNITNRDWKHQYRTTLGEDDENNIDKEYRIPQYQLLMDINNIKDLDKRHIPTIKDLLEEGNTIGPEEIDTNTHPIIYIPSFDDIPHTYEYMFPGLVVNFNKELYKNKNIVQGLQMRSGKTDTLTFPELEVPDITEYQKLAANQAYGKSKDETDYYNEIMNIFRKDKYRYPNKIIHFQMHEMSFFNRVIAACDKYSEVDKVLKYFTKENSDYDDKTMYELFTTPFFIGILDTPCNTSADFDLEKYTNVPKDKEGNPLSSSDISLYELYNAFTPNNSKCKLAFPNILITINSIKRKKHEEFTTIHKLFRKSELDEIHRRYKIYNNAPIPIKRVIMKMLLDEVQNMTTTIKRNVKINNKQLRSELLSPIYAIDSMLNDATYGILEYLNPYQTNVLKQKSLKKKERVSKRSSNLNQFPNKLKVIQKLKQSLIRLLCRIVIFNKLLVPKIFFPDYVLPIDENVKKLIPTILKEHEDVFMEQFARVDMSIVSYVEFEPLGSELSETEREKEKIETTERLLEIKKGIMEDETHLVVVMENENFINKYVNVIDRIMRSEVNSSKLQESSDKLSAFVKGNAVTQHSRFELMLLSMIRRDYREELYDGPLDYTNMNYIVTVLRAFRVMQGTAPYGKDILTPQTQLAPGNICAYMNKLNEIEGLDRGRSDFAKTQSKQTEFCEFKETSGSRRKKRFYTKNRSDPISDSAENEIRKELIEINNLLSFSVKSHSNPYMLNEIRSDRYQQFYEKLIKTYANILFHDIVNKESHDGFDGLPLLYPKMIRPTDLGISNVSESDEFDIQKSIMKDGENRKVVEELVKRGLYDPISSLRKEKGKAVYAKPIGFVEKKKNMTYEERQELEEKKEKSHETLLETLAEEAKKRESTGFEASDINLNEKPKRRTESTESVLMELEDIVDKIKKEERRLVGDYEEIQKYVRSMGDLEEQINRQQTNSKSQQKTKAQFVRTSQDTNELLRIAQQTANSIADSADTAKNIIRKRYPTSIPENIQGYWNILSLVDENTMIAELNRKNSELMQRLKEFSKKSREFDVSSNTFTKRPRPSP